MIERSQELLSLKVPCDVSAPGAVRAALGRFDWLGWVLGDVTLVASEIVSNAVEHSGCLGEHALAVNARLTRDKMVISVRDPGLSGRDAHPRARTAGSPPGGWGLWIVEQLALRWGAERDSGYHVWAEIALPS